MSLVVAFLSLMAVSTGIGLLLCVCFGSLTLWIAWSSLLAGAAVSIFVYGSIKKLGFKAPPVKFSDRLMLFCFGLFILREFLWVYYYDGGLIKTWNPYNLGDLPMHLTQVANFVRGARFWPDNPIFAGQKIHYPFGINLFTAFFVKIGISPETVMPVLGVLAGFAFLTVLFYWSRGFGVGAFLFAGGLAGLQVLIAWQFKDYQHDLAWKSLPLTLLVPQRGFLFAFPAGLVLLWSWRRRFLSGDKPLPVFVEGVLWGLMPLFHFHTFIFLSMIFMVWGLLREKNIPKAWPTLACAAVPATFITFGLTDYFRAASLLWFRPGWMIGTEKPLMFFAVNFGFYIPLLLWTIYEAFRARSRSLKGGAGGIRGHYFYLIIPALLMWGYLFFVMFAPWEWDNMKIMVWCYLLLLPAAEELVVSKVTGLERGLMYVLLFLSGFTVVVSQLGRTTNGFSGYEIFRVEEVDEICQNMKGLDVEGAFAAAQTHNHPVALCGGKLVAGYGGHLASHGLRPAKVEDKLRRLMRGEPDWRELAKDLKVRYLFWGEREKKNFPESTHPWESSNLQVKTGKWGSIYDLHAPASQ
jgi:hypothetical protein